jgi:hypothetical protein
LNGNAVNNGTAHHQNILVAAAAPEFIHIPSAARGAGVAQVDAARLYNIDPRHLRWQ